MQRINFARGEIAGLSPATTALYFLAGEVEPDPEAAPVWEGGPRVEWRYLALLEVETGALLPIAFAEMEHLVEFGKAGREHAAVPPSREVVKVDVESLRQGRCRHDLLVDPDADALEAMLESGAYEWDSDGLESLV